MGIWSIAGCLLEVTLPAEQADPVLPYLDRYMAVHDKRSGNALDISKSSVKRQRGNICLSYLLPVELFDGSEHRIVADCLLFEGCDSEFVFTYQSKEGEVLKPKREADVFFGSVDYYDGERLRGWVISRQNVDEAVRIGVFVNGQAWQTSEASNLRRDLSRKHGGSGRHGFNLTMPNSIFDGKPKVISCAPVDTLRPLRNGLFRSDPNFLESRLTDLIKDRFDRLQDIIG